MTDQNSQFFAILTAVGEAKQANADALGVPWSFSQMGVGDANGTDPIPSRAQTKLINERRRAPLNQLKVDPSNANIIVAEQVIPPDVGGWWIREIGLYDADGDLVAVANCAPSFKPLLSQGTGKTQVVRLNIIVTSTANVQLKIDPSVVLATREYVDTRILSVLPPDKFPGSFTKVRIDARGVVQQGWNPTTLAGYGITDALPNLNPLPYGSLDLHGANFAHVTAVAETAFGQNCYFDGANWVRHDVSKPAIALMLSNNKLAVARVGAGPNPINWETVSTTLDTSNLLFSYLKQLPATLAEHGITNAYTSSEVDQKDTAVIAAIRGPVSGSLDQLSKIAAALNNDPQFSVNTLLALAGKAAKATTLDGYGITDAVKTADKAAQAEVEAGENDSKWVTPKGVFQALAKVVTQATEAAFGWARVASQAQVNAGLDDATMVTPKKLRFGFQKSLGSTGFIVFPDFLGGFIIQWGSSAIPGGSEGADITLPLAYPSASFGLWSMWSQTGQVISTAPIFMGYFPSNTRYRMITNQSSGNYGITWFSIGV